MSMQDYKDYAATMGVILLDSMCAVVLFYVLNLQIYLLFANRQYYKYYSCRNHPKQKVSFQ